jgi:uncharacterized protein YndB with AHSA1/START domain/uncharacterized protein YciI
MSLPPIRRQVVVPAPADQAFDVFTQKIGSWWPVERHSVHGATATAAFQDGRLIETSAEGDQVEWGEVLAWEPPHMLRMTWHPGYGAERASEVEVSFAPVTPSATLVTVTHSGWERFSDPAAARDEYGSGWPGVLSGFAAQLPGSVAPGEPVWLVLSHTPAPGVARPIEHPDFGGHPAFLDRLNERGVLVAAGPFPASGEGMTVVRVPPDEVDLLVGQANDDDLSVVNGVLEVRVRPWLVTLTGSSLA